MVRLQKKLNCSQKKLLSVAREFKSKGIKFEEHIREDLDKLSHSLDAYYTVEKLEFVEKKKKKNDDKKEGKKTSKDKAEETKEDNEKEGKEEEEKEKKKDEKKTAVELDLLYLKDPPAFIEHVIKERGLDRDKVLVRVGMDGGQGSFKVVASIFETDYDPEITLSSKEGPGTRLTGANRLLDLVCKRTSLSRTSRTTEL